MLTLAPFISQQKYFPFDNISFAQLILEKYIEMFFLPLRLSHFCIAKSYIDAKNEKLFLYSCLLLTITAALYHRTFKNIVFLISNIFIGHSLLRLPFFDKIYAYSRPLGV